MLGQPNEKILAVHFDVDGGFASLAVNEEINSVIVRLERDGGETEIMELPMEDARKIAAAIQRLVIQYLTD